MIIEAAHSNHPRRSFAVCHGRARSAKRVFAPDVPAIHVFLASKTWMPRTRPGMTDLVWGAAAIPYSAARPLFLDAVALVSFLTTCTRRLASDIGWLGSLSLLLPYPTVTRAGPLVPYFSGRGRLIESA